MQQPAYIFVPEVNVCDAVTRLPAEKTAADGKANMPESHPFLFLLYSYGILFISES